MSDRAILSGAVRVALFVILAKVIVASREVVIAWRYGVSPVSDAFNVSLTLGTWLPVLLSGAVGAGIVPALVRSQAAENLGEEEGFIRELNAHALILALFTTSVGVGLAFLAPSAFGTGNPAIDARVHALLLAFAPFAGLTTIFYYLSNRLQARGSFIYTLFECLPALFVALAILFAAADRGVLAYASGIIIGGIVQVLILWFLLRRDRVNLERPRLARRAPEWPVLLAGIGMMALGQAVLSLVLPIDQFFALRAGEGVPAAFGYANRIIGLGTSLGTLVLGRALLPTLAALRVGDASGGARTAKAWIVYSFALGLAGLGIGWFLAEPVTALVFQRGSFTGSDTQVVGRLLRLGLLQLPFFLSGVAAVQWLAVEGRYRSITLICLATVLVKISLLLVLVPRFGAGGLMLSTAGMYVAAWGLQISAVALGGRKASREATSPHA